MKRSKLSIISFILTILIIVSSIPVSAVADNGRYLNDTSSSSVSRKSDYSYVDDIVSEEIAEEHADELSCRITDYVDKAQFESQNYAFRVEQDESLNTYVFQKEDGKRVVYFLDENVKFIDDNGEIKEKNLSLTSTEKGFSPTCNDIDILLPTTIKESIQFNYGKFSIAITPSGENSAEGKSDGKSVSYTGVFGENTILRYTPMLSGLKEDIIVTDKSAPTEYSFVLKTNGLSIRSDEDGFYLSLTENSEEKIRLGNVVAYDSNGRESIGELFVNTVSEGSEYVVTIYVDSKFLIDESTVFPVTIDPTFTVSDNTHGSNAIQDAPIFQGYPNGNFGNYIYNSVGTPDSNFGIGRTVVKLNGFTSATEYTTITASQIDSVLFYAKEASGSSTQTINLHPITGVSSWTENTVTWNAIGNSFNTSIDFGTTMYNGQWSSFDITNLVKGWKSGSYVADCGFILKNSSEANYKNFHSCECTTTGNRPYVVMTYTPTISLNYSSFDIGEGSTRTITATTHPSGLSVSWSTSNSAAATVSGGIVTGVAAKTTSVTITASVTIDGTPYTATCQVYVIIPDGVYYLKNQNSNYYLHVEDGNIHNFTDVIQFSLYESSSANAYRIRQLWKIKYLGSGKYSVRPMHKLNMGLDYNNGNVDIYTIGITDSFSGIIYDARWSIGRYSNSSSGLIFQNNGDTSKTMQVSNASITLCASVIAGNYSTSSNCRWTPTLVSSPPVGVIIYDTATGIYVNPAIRYVTPTETISLYSLGLTAAFYSSSSITQTVTWSSSNSSVALVNSSSGSVTGVSPGTATIYANRLLNGLNYSASYTVNVTGIANGTYFIKSNDTSRFVDIEDQNMVNGTNIHQWDFHGGNSQRWIFTHIGDGYYSIKSANSTSNYYLGVLNDGTATDTQVVLRTGSLTNGMKWKVSVTTSGAYKITPKTGEPYDRVLAVGWYALNVNGIDIKQRDYVDDGNYKDEWNLCMIDPDYTNMYIGTSDGDTVMPGILRTVKNQFKGNGYFGNSLNSSTKDELIYMLKNSDVFSAITHGSQTSIRLTGNVSFLVSDVNAFGSSDLNSLTFVYLGACETGKGGASATNLVNAFYTKGVDNVVGFTISVLVDETNFWTTKFMSNIANGQSIATAISNADYSIQNDPTLGGRSSYTISSRLIKGPTSAIPCP